MAVEICYFETKVNSLDDARYSSEPGWFTSMQTRAAEELARRIIYTSAKFKKIIPPEHKSHEPTRYVWTIGVERDMSEIELREKQLEEARAEGRSQAAYLVASRADQYARLTGSCAGVISSALSDAARDIRKI